MGDAVSAARRALAATTVPASGLCAPFVAALPIDSAAILTLVAPFDVVIFCSSNALAAELADAEIDLGDGPGWEALRRHATVREPRLIESRSGSWPAFRSSLGRFDLTGLYAVPLSIGSLDIGAIDLYLHNDQQLSEQDLHDASVMADLTAMHVFRHAMEHRDDDQDADDDAAPYSRREVHQATGMVIAQLNVSPTDALLLLRAHAFALGRPVRSVAADIVARRLTFRP